MSRTGTKPASIDGYLAAIDADKRAALQKLRRAIHAAVPGLEECISYQMPAFRHQGKVLVWFAAGARHCAFYPGAVVQDFSDELGAYETSKGTIRFQPDRPLPAVLVRKLVRARIGDVAVPAQRTLARAKSRKARPSKTRTARARSRSTR